MLQFNAGVEPLPSRMIFWSDTFLEHEKANHSDIIRNHPFNYRMEIVLNFYNHNDSTTEASHGLVAYDEEQSLENNNKPSRHLPEVNSKELIQNILNLCTDLKDKSVVYLCSNIQPVDIISYVQERVLTREESSSDYLVYCHTLGAHTDCLSANQMAIYPIFKTSSSSTHGINVTSCSTPLEREHHLRFRLDQDTLLEIGLQRNEKNKIHSKKTSAHSANFESDNYSTVGYKMPFKPKSKEYERLMWSLNKEGTCPMHCFFGVFSIEKNGWIEMSDFESFVQSRINSNTTNSEETFGASSTAENKVLIKKTSGKDIFNVRILKEESLVLPRVELSIETIAKGGEKSEQNKHPSTACNTLEGFSQLQQLGHHAPPSNLMDETSDNEDDHEEGEHDEDDNDENDEHDEVSHHLFSMFSKSLSPSEEKEICKQETAKAILTSVGLLSGGMGSECLSASDDSKSSEVTTSSSTTHQEDASFVNIVAQRNHLLFMNALMHDVKFARVDQTFIIKLDGILPPLFVEKIFELVWKGTRVGKCWNAFLVTGMEDAVVSWKKFNHTYSVSGENDYLYVIFPTTYSSTKQQEITPNWLIQILNQQDEFS